MQLTEEQRAELDRQRREQPGRRRFTLTFTPEQREPYRRAVAEEMAARDANIRRAQRTPQIKLMSHYAAKFDTGLPYADFLKKYANPDQLRRWNDFHATVHLTPQQTALLQSFVREMKVLVVAGAWCGDCVNQCPIFLHFEQAQPKIRVRYFDRDDHPDLTAELQTCGGARVPTVVFLSEDGHVCGRFGDRTLSKYRSMIAGYAGPACPSGVTVEGSLTDAVVQDWLNEFERIQWMLRTSSRLRQLHGD